MFWQLRFKQIQQLRSSEQVKEMIGINISSLIFNATLLLSG
ncbi:MAG: hypothetical protein P8Y42_17720 [Exilibacterium sp.]